MTLLLMFESMSNLMAVSEFGRQESPVISHISVYFVLMCDSYSREVDINCIVCVVV